MNARVTDEPTPAALPSMGAILLAGGRASRMGGVDKTRLPVNGSTMFDRALAAGSRLGCSPIVAVGPRPDDTGEPDTPPLRWAREDPPFSGPAAAVVTALDAGVPSRPEWMLVLACDLPFPELAVASLVRALADHVDEVDPPDGLCLTDATGRAQWLTAVYRTDALRRAAASLADRGRDQSMRALLSGLEIVTIDADADATDDIDTWDDYDRITKGAS